MKKIYYILSSVIVFAGLFFTIYGSWVPYSYWWDELYSVVSSSLPINKLFSEFILRDVHPPFYSLLLKFWIMLFGNSEIAARSLSLIFTLSAFLLLLHFSKKNVSYLSIPVLLVFFTTNRLFIYYAQEARSYAMVLFLSTFLTSLFVDYLKNISGSGFKLIISIGIVSLLLSLTHYFGLLYSGLILWLCLTICIETLLFTC
jgi:uncharacterized membrane protein